MKQLVLGTLAIGMALTNLANTALATDITIRVSQIDNSRGGNVMVMIFAEDGYPKNHDKALMTQTRRADRQMLYFTIPIDREEFAIKALHDEDETGTVSKNWTGMIPSEGLGFSNNARISWKGPPTYLDSKILLKDIKGPVQINIIYP